MPAKKILVAYGFGISSALMKIGALGQECRGGRRVVSRHRAYADVEAPDCTGAAAGPSGNRVRPSPKAESRLAAFVKAISKDTKRDPL